MAEEWLPRKRPRTADTPRESPNSPSFDLTPHLQWTKLTSCHIKQRKPTDNHDITNEQLRRVKGKAIFFLHDANSDLRQDGDASDGDVQDNLTWFQGRFFPSPLSSFSSPTSHNDNSFSTSKSWGILGIQKHVQDECLRCSEGGYRELDLTFLRHVPHNNGGQTKKVIRWKAQNLTWTGGDMMRLSSDYVLRDDVRGVKFDPFTLMEGKKAWEIGTKYFPKLVKQLMKDDKEKERETLVVIGSMDIVVPVDFVHRGGELKVPNEEEDGLWSD
jgi:hypothetical protein